MKVIFLDHDGVICLSTEWGGRYKKQNKWGGRKLSMTGLEIPVEYRFDNFNKKAISILNEILEETGAEIVVSSDWKRWATVEEMGEYYEAQGIIKKPIATTPNLYDFDQDTAGLFHWKGWMGRARILEIKKYLELHPDITHWVAIDDLNMSPEYNQDNGLEHFILTPRSNEGIKQSGIKDKLINKLK